MGKGSTPRPLSVARETFAERWEKAFGGRQRPGPDIPRYYPHPDASVSSSWSDANGNWHRETPEKIAAWWNRP